MNLKKSDLVGLKDTLDYLNISDNDLKSQDVRIDWDNHFVYKCTYSYLKRMQPNNPLDPLLLQVLPLQQENTQVPGYTLDPLHEAKAVRKFGLLQKFKNRALVITTQNCPSHCRFCFRRNFNYQQHRLSAADRKSLYQEINSDLNLNEIILSGGDPLSLPDTLLNEYVENFAKIDHVKTLRIHTRYNIFYPERINTELVNIIKKFQGRIVWVMHTNHAQELNDDVQKSIDILLKNNITVLNQTVLLNKINNSVQNLVKLSYKLHQYSVLPYYLHLIDKTEGVAHFDINLQQAVSLYDQLKQELPGYLLPKLAREIPGLAHKEYIV